MGTRPVTYLLCVLILCAWAEGKRQKRAWIIDSFSIEEENPGPFPYKLGNIQLDRKYLVNFELSGEGVDITPKGILQIDNKGDIYVKGKLDYEGGYSKYLKLAFVARNKSNNAVDTRLGIEIRILDINDHAPKFQKSVYVVNVAESHTQGKSIMTILASDADDSSTLNGTFVYQIKSVSPKTDNIEFYLDQHQEHGTISFRGCLDYEKASKYTLLVEAKDKGEKVQLSSTSTVIINVSDENNNLPEFSGRTGPGKVKERDTGVEVLRLQVTDKDTPGTKAWNSKYTIHGDATKNFKIETDSKSNDGILTVIQALDYEEQTYQNLSISVQNEIPYFSCKVIRKVPNALWDLDTGSDKSGDLPTLYKTSPVTIQVEDVNDPPVFVPPVREVVEKENIAIGKTLATFTAKDVDENHENTFKFVKGEDIGGWITIDPKTGQVTTDKILDRESPFVINDTYRATVYAVDDGVPPLTGTGTLLIHLNDQNDNVPKIEVNNINICLEQEATTANITATDPDLPPYSSPFYYELLGDVKNKWRFEPTQGTTVSLVKEPSVFSGLYQLQVKVSDQQGVYAIQNLSVTVCNCFLAPQCHVERQTTTRMGSGGSWILVSAVVILMAMALLTLLISCKKEKKMIEMGEGLGRLITTNTENPGTDCMVHSSLYTDQTDFQLKSNNHLKVSNGVNSRKQTTQNTISYENQMTVSQAARPAERTFDFRQTMTRSSLQRSYQEHFQRSTKRSSFRSTSYNANNPYPRENVAILIHQKLAAQAGEEDFSVYPPHCYADEGKPMAQAQLDAISMSENDFHPEMLMNLGSKFKMLATISRPDLTGR